ncbi:TPA: VanZ family protein [Enterococcus faecium]|uniref:VanZ family protein n=1 Tax=Enterococcus faecium TaxID=1352 RepID=UPI000A33228F|nr:VanZ family protein [Enterococcus faecium]EMF0354336.1 VanZ family protein [Enterococcus faecium]MBK1310249.1 VanZ family protein [Enterococcus faecium]MDW7854073.1 VanZ family protein [Enterococcus faecium]OTO06810.1 hypothetical protein A5801_000849 [Enterococcus faecium]PQB79907.1 VanZ family protein [Enterococcus faecium]
MREKVGKILFVILVGMIFVFSYQPAEQPNIVSDAVAHQVLSEEITESSNVSFLPPLFGLSIRKYAHIGLYFLLGAAFYLAVNRKKHIFIKLLIPMVACFIAVSFYEAHQMFLPDRTGKVEDIMIDSIEFIVSIALSLTVSRIFFELKKE